ncbi:hypothetical protein [Mucilaginibacter pedocola]|uniref:Uncharacterized protein n=1 Tax=Mucilaginibacter pedocola TaxID=1792845 RepID=A0A1S9PKY7_9SPHI|nr:hypothetical protein [Mucilaginibacter pedocola]OOQ61632.1 hypothetical protein BC343_00720 [Mucilaginibacter pedocola]
MEQQFDAVLTGSDSEVNGIATRLNSGAYEFNSLDGSLQLIIAKNAEGKWERVAGTEPYFGGWIEELVAQIPVTVNS